VLSILKVGMDILSLMESGSEICARTYVKVGGSIFCFLVARSIDATEEFEFCASMAIIFDASFLVFRSCSLMTLNESR